MNEIFNYNRFWRYFKFDIVSILREQGVKLLSAAIAPSAIYVLLALANLIFDGTWNGGGQAYRVFVFVLMTLWFVLAFAGNYYGKITDRKTATSWLMIPASVTEKFASMLLNSLVICPAIYLLVYFAVDGILCLLDPSAGAALLSSLGHFNDFMKPIIAGPFTMSGITIPFYVICTTYQIILTFLLGSIFFKKNKVAKTILASIVLSTVVMFVVYVCVAAFNNIYGIETLAQKLVESEGKLETFATIAANTLFLLATLVPLAVFGTGIFFRLRSIKA